MTTPHVVEIARHGRSEVETNLLHQQEEFDAPPEATLHDIGELPVRMMLEHEAAKARSIGLRLVGAPELIDAAA